MNLEVGDICLVKPPKQSLLGRIITAVTMSPYSHTFVIFHLKEFTTVIYDIGTTTKLRSLKSYDNAIYDVYRMKDGLSDEQKTKIQDWCMTHLEIKYDYIQLFSFLDKFLFKLNYVFNLPNRYVCSEAIDRLYTEALGMDLMPKIREGEVTPADLSKSLLLYKVV